MSLKRIFAIIVRQFFLYKSNLMRLVSMFLWPLISILQWGFVMKYLIKLGEDTISFTTFILGAVVMYEFMTRIMNGIMVAFLEDVWSRNFLNLFASPIKIEEYLSGLVLFSIVIGIVNFLIISIIAALVFRYNLFKFGVVIWSMLFNLFIFGVAFGFFVSAIIFKFGPAAEWISWPIPALLSIVSGIFYPVSVLPKWLQYISKIFPTTYIFECLRNIILNKAHINQIIYNFNLSFLLSLTFLFLNFLLFLKIYQYNLKSGAIARFIAFE